MAALLELKVCEEQFHVEVLADGHSPQAVDVVRMLLRPQGGEDVAAMLLLKNRDSTTACTKIRL